MNRHLKIIQILPTPPEVFSEFVNAPPDVAVYHYRPALLAVVEAWEDGHGGTATWRVLPVMPDGEVDEEESIECRFDPSSCPISTGGACSGHLRVQTAAAS